ncbi:hypothetical protein Taro_052787 [Colocasia esculenta]|uniref:Uncharacterized protein n=1 Tax=Colocasia esculenta TaxID=4460 RepID=A0A843XKA3_COLES|nr:hypothetical protein [Colocasia esculenta]
MSLGLSFDGQIQIELKDGVCPSPSDMDGQVQLDFKRQTLNPSSIKHSDCSYYISDNCKGSSTNSGIARHALHLPARSARNRCGTLLSLDFFLETTPSLSLTWPRLLLQLPESTAGDGEDGKVVKEESRVGEDRGVKTVKVLCVEGEGGPCMEGNRRSVIGPGRSDP